MILRSPDAITAMVGAAVAVDVIETVANELKTAAEYIDAVCTQQTHK